MQQCPLISDVTALTHYLSTALAPYGETAISSISGQLQEISNYYATPSTDLSTEFTNGMGWSRTPLIAVGVVVVGAALIHAWEWWRHSGSYCLEPAPGNAAVPAAQWNRAIQQPPNLPRLLPVFRRQGVPRGG